MWLLLGIALGSGLLLLVLWLKSRGINLKWYEWILGLIGVALMLFTLQNYQASVAELEPNAPGMFLLVFGTPALFFILLTAFLVWFRTFRARKAPVVTEIIETK